jgi:uncharacterized protein (DUF1800 family)
VSDESVEEPSTDARPGRRAVVAGLAGTGVSIAAWAVVRDLTGTSGTDHPLAPPTEVRQAASRPADAGGFANRDESYASSVEQVSAVHAPPPTLVFPTAGEAAAATAVTVPTILDTSDPVIHLLRRTTFGPTPGMVEDVHARGIDAWLASQLDPMAIADPFADNTWSLFELASADPATIRSSTDRYSWDAMLDHSKATLTRQIWSERQLFEVMVDFWSNHLNAPTPGPGSWDVGPSYHADVIRQHALGTFSDMLVAAARHPAMLRYLTAAQSTKDSVNENLGRELLELHTVGVASGYTETDVRNSAYILTGRTVVGEDGPGTEGTFRYDPDKHWVGAVTVLDFSHDNASAEGGLEVGDAYLRHLAAHPATAQTIARKLAVRFVSDVPPPELVERLATAYLDGGTAVVPVLDALFRSAEFWASVGQKTRRPLENTAASARALGITPGTDTVDGINSLYHLLNLMGHRPNAWPAPNGYPDVHAAWRSASGVSESWNMHRHLAHGWSDGISEPTSAGLLAGQPAGTVAEYVDSLCRRLCFQAFSAPHRDALVAYAGTDAAAPLSSIDVDQTFAPLASLILDSPYFALR